MAGAAAVAASVIAAAEMGLPVAVSGCLCLAGEHAGGNAQLPGDIVTRSGTTVEIIDTDAEGRMVLADGLAPWPARKARRARRRRHLTGACMIALGNKVAGLMSNDDDFGARVLASADRPASRCRSPPCPGRSARRWRSDRHHQHKGRPVRRRADRRPLSCASSPGCRRRLIPWAHLDIAGPAYFDRCAVRPIVVRGGTVCRGHPRRARRRLGQK